ncbi:MAG: hemagglutinin repeat-containing protein, partial [Pseudomonadales bacterium]|nr:hemagglutinin repeat-containing protein [Pseudomonadales bacterium]
GSAIVSQGGDVTLTAGNKATIAASDVGAGQNLTIAAKEIELQARQDTTTSQVTQSSRSSGFSVGLTLDPVAAFKSASSAATGNMPNTGSTLNKLSRKVEGDNAGVAAATTAVVFTAGSQKSNSQQNASTSDARVSQLMAGGDLTLLATDGSISSQGAQLSAEGNATLLATENIILDVAHNTQTSDQNSKGSGWSYANNTSGLPVGVFNQKADGVGETDTVTGTQLSVGGDVTMATLKGDIALTASEVVADGDVNIHAAGNLTIQSGQDTASGVNRSNNKAIGTVVISDTERFAGYHAEKHRDDNDQVIQVASTVASLDGNVNLSAGNAYTQTASSVVAAKDVDITAATIDLKTADNAFSASQKDDSLKVGAFARVTSPLINLINNVDAARKSDGRVQTARGMAAAADAYQVGSAIAGMVSDYGSGELFKAEVGTGFATSDSSYKGQSQISQGSNVSGGGNVTLTTTEGDLHITQGSLSAGDTLSLSSAKDLILEAGKSTGMEKSDGHNAGFETGVGVSVGVKTGVYAYVQANAGSNHANTKSATYQNTHLGAETINLTAQNDTTLRGAVAQADTINVDTGGTLTIESLQDSIESKSESSGFGVRVQVAYGSAWTASGNMSESQAKGSYLGVNEQSGLFAGDGGYHVNADTVDLVGGAITSTNAEKSDLTANELKYRNLENKMKYSASSASISASVGASTTPSFGGGLPMQESGGDSSTTYATLTEGNITIGGKQTTAEELGINTDAANAHRGIEELPDLQKIQSDQQAISAALGTVLSTVQQVAGDIATYSQKQAAEKYFNDLSLEDKVRFNGLNDDQKRAELLDKSQDYKDAQEWGIGGNYSRALQVVATALVGAVAGQGGTQIAANALGPYAAKLIGEQFGHGSEQNEAVQVLAHALLGAALAEANGANAAGGALAGAGGELAAQYLAKQLYGTDDPSQLSDDKKQTILALSQAVGALAGGLVGGDLNEAAAGANIAKNAVENNKLTISRAAAQYIEKLRASSAEAGKILDAMEAHPVIDFRFDVGTVRESAGGGETRPQVLKGSFLDWLVGNPPKETVFMTVDPKSTVQFTDIFGNSFKPSTERIFAHEMGHGYTYLLDGNVGMRINYHDAITYENMIYRQLDPNAPIRAVSDHGDGRGFLKIK